MLKKTVAALLCLSMVLVALPAFAEDFAMRHITFSATTNQTTLNNVPTLQFLFVPNAALQEQLDVADVGVGVTGVYDQRMTVSFTLMLTDSPNVGTVAAFRQSYDRITVTNVPVSPDTKYLADGRFALRIRPEDMVLYSPELTEWSQTHPNWITELGYYSDSKCFLNTTDIIAHYDRDGITVSDAAACEECAANVKVTEQRISTSDDGFSLSDASVWSASTWPDSTGAEFSGVSYYGNTLDAYVQYTPHNLEEGYYDVFIWNMKCNDQQDPMKMSATIYSNNMTFTNIPLEVTTATVNRTGTWTKVGTYYFAGTNDEYLRLVSNGGTNARPADAKFVKTDTYTAPDTVTFRHITTTGMGFSKSSGMVASTMPDSTGSTANGVSLYASTAGEYAQYAPYYLEPGWYDISFWNLKYEDHQDPMKMTGTVYAGGELTQNIPLDVSTATENRTGAWTKVGTYYFAGTNDEYFRLVATGGSNARPADVKFEKNDSYIPPVTLVTEQRISTSDSGFSLSNASAWFASTWPDSTGATTSGISYYGNSAGEYAQYMPRNLEPGWYDVSFWNMKCFEQQNPVKMTGTVYANGKTRSDLPLAVTTATVDREGSWTLVGTFYFAGTNDEYLRLVSNGGTNARPADAKFVKNDSFVPPPALGDPEASFAPTDGKWEIEGADGSFRMYANITNPITEGLLSVYVNNTLVDQHRLATEQTGRQFIGTYTFTESDNVEVIYSTLFPDYTMPIDQLIFTPASGLSVQYNLFNLQREKEQYFIEASDYRVSADIQNNSSATNVKLIAVLYADEISTDGEPIAQMKKVVTSDKIAVAANSSTTVSVQIPITSIANGEYLCVFAWEGFDTMTPHAVARTYPAASDAMPSAFSIIPASFSDLGTWQISTFDAALNRTTMDGLKTAAPANAKPATVSFSAQPGQYRVWVHTKNFTDRPLLRHAQVEIGGVLLDKTFGQVGQDGWFWEDGGVVDLDGDTELKLIDSSASFAKCDMIIVTTDTDYTPVGDYNNLIKAAPPIYAHNTALAESDMMTDFHLDKNYPGGNYVLNYMENNVVSISPDSSDAGNTWWYWNFKATSDTDRQVTFNLSGFEYTSLVGYSGVVYSTDGGDTWDYLNENQPVSQTSFTYDFTAGETVQFASVMPYQLSDLQAFIPTIENIPGVDVSVLCQTEEGRDVPMIRIGDPNAPYAVMLTARHHCSETTPSYVMEGLLTYLANHQNSEVFENYCFYAVPIVDLDGVEDGDQGKGRLPHDHNRDYGIGRYAAPAAIMALADNLDFQFAFDIHGPSLRDYGPYFSYYSDNQDLILAFSDLLVAASEADTTPNKIVYTGTYNRLGTDTATEQMKAWFHRVEGAPFAVTFEFPYSGGNDGDPADAYTQSRMFNFGTLLADTILDYLTTMIPVPEE